MHRIGKMPIKGTSSLWSSLLSKEGWMKEMSVLFSSRRASSTDGGCTFT